MARERLQKILSECGYASRRKAEEYIQAGKVKVNGHVAHLGDKADIHVDHITVFGKKITNSFDPVYVMFHKPRGVVTTLQDEQGRKCVTDFLKDIDTRVYPVGRLDRDSEGMLLLTNDGEFAQAIMHPSSHVTKQYRVTVRPSAKDDQLFALRNGIVIDSKKTLPAEVEIVTDSEERTVLHIYLHEGRNRQIRRMCESVGLEVARLKRIAIGNVKLGGLAVGKWRYLDSREVKQLLNAAKPKSRMQAASRYIRENHN